MDENLAIETWNALARSELRFEKVAELMKEIKAQLHAPLEKMKGEKGKLPTNMKNAMKQIKEIEESMGALHAQITEHRRNIGIKLDTKANAE